MSNFEVEKRETLSRDEAATGVRWIANLPSGSDELEIELKR